MVFTLAHYAIAKKYADYEMSLSEDGLVFQPRDGTRYVFVFNRLTPATQRALGCPDDGLLVTLFNGNNQAASACFSPGVYSVYIQEKLKCSTHTSKVVEQVLKFVFECKDIGPFPMQGLNG